MFNLTIQENSVNDAFMHLLARLLNYAEAKTAVQAATSWFVSVYFMYLLFRST